MKEVKTTIYCDRCGRKIEEDDYRYTVDFFNETEKSFETDPKDLCFDCAKSFKEWMIQGKKELYES